MCSLCYIKVGGRFSCGWWSFALVELDWVFASRMQCAHTAHAYAPWTWWVAFCCAWCCSCTFGHCFCSVFSQSRCAVVASVELQFLSMGVKGAWPKDGCMCNGDRVKVGGVVLLPQGACGTC
jgi:hypothetical protein